MASPRSTWTATAWTLHLKQSIRNTSKALRVQGLQSPLYCPSLFVFPFSSSGSLCWWSSSSRNPLITSVSFSSSARSDDSFSGKRTFGLPTLPTTIPLARSWRRLESWRDPTTSNKFNGNHSFFSSHSIQDEEEVVVDDGVHVATKPIPPPEPESCPFASLSTFETVAKGIPLPPPLPEPKFTFLRRVLKEDKDVNDEDKKDENDHNRSSDQKQSSYGVVALDSQRGRSRLLRAMQQNTAQSYWALWSHFSNQSEPTYCGVTTLLIVLNAFAVDPLRRWKGGWRYYGHEDLLLHNCTCLEPERLKRTGVTLPQLAQLAVCQGLALVQVKRPLPLVPVSSPLQSFPMDSKINNNNKVGAVQTSHASLDDFRQDVLQVMTTTTSSAKKGEEESNPDDPTRLKWLMVASYDRLALGQTGEGGHFSPLAAYDSATDSVLVLDVARFKYPPYWVTLYNLYQAMAGKDRMTGQSRGWMIFHPPQLSSSSSSSSSSLSSSSGSSSSSSYSWYQGSIVRDEAKRPVEQIPAMDQPSPCPGHQIKVEYCPNKHVQHTQHF